MTRHDRYLRVATYCFVAVLLLLVWWTLGSCSPSPTASLLTIETVWKEAENRVFILAYEGYSFPLPTFEQARDIEPPINCSIQAALLYGYLQRFVEPSALHIATWEALTGGWHSNVLITIGSTVWVIDRNYGTEYPVMPMTLRDWRHFYDGKIQQVG